MLDINLYMEDWQAIAERPIIHTTEIPFSLRNKNIILVDDILASGRTIQAAMESLLDGGRPHSIWLAILIDIGRRRFPIQPDFCGITEAVDDDEILLIKLREMEGPLPDMPEGVVVSPRIQIASLALKR
jgi:pyrimidine operon attenuation protein/uracil phosphoribosyltransferase